MRQLGQLQKSYAEFNKMDTEIVAVFREEADGVEGLQKSISKTRATYPMLLDLKKQRTAAYSDTGFATYIVDKQGKIAAILPGTKRQRPGPKAILAKLKALQPKPEPVGVGS
ncbi:MAG: redoxin domain-containing protein [Planctomycetota bacterium]